MAISAFQPAIQDIYLQIQIVTKADIRIANVEQGAHQAASNLLTWHALARCGLGLVGVRREPLIRRQRGAG